MVMIVSLVDWLIKLIGLIELKKGSQRPNFPTSAFLFFLSSHPLTLSPSVLCPQSFGSLTAAFGRGSLHIAGPWRWPFVFAVRLQVRLETSLRHRF